MRQSLAAGAAYFAIVFALGFVLGTIRVLVLSLAVGDIGGTLIEPPVMLAASSFVCGSLVLRFRVPPDWPDRLAMGGVAFGLLMAAELCMSILLFGRSPGAHLETYRSWGAIAGLVGQLLFAAMPLAQRKFRPLFQ